MKRAPVGMVVLLSFGTLIGWLAATRFCERELTLMQRTLDIARAEAAMSAPYERSVPEWPYVAAVIALIAASVIVGIGVGRRAGAAARREPTSATLTPLRALERYYITLGWLRGDIDRMVWLAKEKEGASDSWLYLAQSRVEAARSELMNLAPHVLTVSTAIAFQKKPDASGYVPISERLPQTITDLMDTIERHWRQYAASAGILATKLDDRPVVKFEQC